MKTTSTLSELVQKAFEESTRYYSRYQPEDASIEERVRKRVQEILEVHFSAEISQDNSFRITDELIEECAREKRREEGSEWGEDCKNEEEETSHIVTYHREFDRGEW